MPKEKKREVITLSSPVSVLSGVGTAKIAAYAKAGVQNLGDLIMHVPRAYENRGDIRTLAQSRTDGGRTAVILTVATQPQAARLKGRMTIVKFRAFDESGTAELIFFNMPYLRQTFTVGSEWRFFGIVERKPIRGGVLYKLSCPAFEPYTEGTLRDFVSVYPLTEGLTQKLVASNVEQALSLCGPPEDHLPDEIRRRRGLCTLSYAVKNIHNPENYVALAASKRRLIYDEFFLFSLSAAMRGKKARDGHAYPCRKQNITPLLHELPYELTGAQKRSISEIAADMRGEIPMRRILIGDVGCGKTVVAAAAMLIAVMSGRQAALMAPTEILARQHYEDLSELFGKLGIRCELLIGATPAAEKRRICAALSDTDPETRLPIIIGTHALISESVHFSALSLAVTDEQHRFGVNQRAALISKTDSVHVLSMSATPIPRSLALVLYGDLDISRIDEMPPGRQRVDTFVVDESYRERLLAFIRRTAIGGGQVYVVCPSIEENPSDSGEVPLGDITDDGIAHKPPLKAAVEYAEKLQAELPELTVAFVHGKLKSAQKEAIMTSFEGGDIDVLVSTTVIEVGVNVPNASLMIVENAERFGLSQLHQLRGRVGRGTRKSHCILVSDDLSENARRRLSVMKENYDGFSIAEADLSVRGPGDFLSASHSGEVRQSGGLRFRFADLCGDASTFAAATEDARTLAAQSPALEEYPLLRATLSGLGTGNGND